MIAIGSDHGGYRLKEEIKAHLTKRGLEFEDFGCFSEESCDYPEIGHAVAHAIASRIDRGVTYLYAQGYYSGNDTKVILCAVKQGHAGEAELHKLDLLMRSQDLEVKDRSTVEPALAVAQQPEDAIGFPTDNQLFRHAFLLHHSCPPGILMKAIFPFA